MTLPLSEHELIATYFAPLAGEGAFGLRDDAAMFKPTSGYDLVITTDALVAGVHFFPDDPARSVARKALSVNLSDLAAKGAIPRAFVITLALNSTHNLEWVRDFCEGLSQTIRESNCVLLGGDTVYTSGPLMVSITAFGEVESRRMVTRLNARAGDIIAITGAIGDGALGLKLRTDNTFLPNLDPESRYYLIDRYLHPQPRLNLRNALIQYASAAMDVSDGLIGDLERMIKASRDTSGLGLGARITLDAVPLSPSARIAIGYAHELHETALTGGDDYEILCTVPPQHFKAFRALVHSNALDVTPIGEMTMSGRVVCEDNKGTERTFSTPAYRHF